MSTPESRIPPEVKKKKDPIEALFKPLPPLGQDATRVATGPTALEAAQQSSKANVGSIGPLPEKLNKMVELFGRLPGSVKDPNPLQKVVSTLTGVDLGNLDPTPVIGMLGEQNPAGVTKRVVGKQLAREGSGGFFSRVEDAIVNAPQEKMTGGQWLGALKSHKAGTPKSERDWTGIDDYLKENAGKVITKDEVLEKAREKSVKIKETVLGGKSVPQLEWQDVDAPYTPTSYGSPTPGEATVVSSASMNGGEDTFEILKVTPSEGGKEYFIVEHNGGRLGTLHGTLQEAQIRAQQRATRRVSTATETKYDRWTQKGGENYREILLQMEDLPDSKLSFEEWFEKHYPGLGPANYADEVTYNQAFKEWENSNIFPASRSHFDQDNIFSHIRVKDRIGPDGEKVLFVEEIQSDWSRLGRKHGFGKQDAIARREQVQEKVNKVNEELDGLYIKQWGFGSYDETQREILKKEKELNKLRSEYRDLDQGSRNNESVPDFPLKRQEDWVGISLKRVIDEAVAGDYDTISWATGNQVAKKMGIAEEFDNVRYYPQSQTLIANRKGRRSDTNSYQVAQDELPNYIGEELAERLLATERTPSLEDPIPGSGAHELSGVNLIIGGEKHKNLYDKVIPSYIKEYAKKQGVQIEIEPIDVGINNDVRILAGDEEEDVTDLFGYPTMEEAKRYVAENEKNNGRRKLKIVPVPGDQQMSIKVTPLKEKVSKQGQPLMSVVPAAAIANEKRKEKEK